MYYYNMVRIADSNKSAKPNKWSSSKGNIYCEKKVIAQITKLKSIFKYFLYFKRAHFHAKEGGAFYIYNEAEIIF